ncbi:rRNA maturation RNase YbeY [Salinicoccus luteus]|uniref:rRNA maturation RNase YbeY n=1 Tax=Salinicoccus luteus TaxID=367840 RepID=UPI0004E1C243|nr:rRNA maturation RNase YbeY [Salinicoccus luteus]
MINIDFMDEDGFTDENQKNEIESLISFAYGHLDEKDDAEISISFVGEAEIKDINRDYRGKDAVTDVISFAMEDEDDNVIHEDAPRMLGDIIICTDRAEAQAREYGHSYKRELMFLSLHGFLHLLGYDHMEPGEEKEMNRLQDEILEAFGVTRED